MHKNNIIRKQERFVIDEIESEMQRSLSSSDSDTFYFPLSIVEDHITLVTSKDSEKLRKFLDGKDFTNKIEIRIKGMEEKQ